jgi:RNA polymerase sigma factor (sigma-70 family)
MREKEELVRYYQETGQCEELIQAYQNFIQKYHDMFVTGVIDFTNYDLRKFLACYIDNKDLVRSLCRGKFHSREVIVKAHEVLRRIRKAFTGYEPDEIYHELLILFLECAKNYEDIGKNFSGYLFHSYRYHLKRWIDNRLLDAIDETNETYKESLEINDDDSIEDSMEITYVNRPFKVDVHEQMDLNNVLWLNGIVCGELFKDFTYTERYILVKLYQDHLSVKEIAQLTGLNPFSIYKIRRRLVSKLNEKRRNGEIKWMR